MPNYVKAVQRAGNKVNLVTLRWESLELKFRAKGPKGEVSRIHLYGARDRDALYIPKMVYCAMMRQIGAIFGCGAKAEASPQLELGLVFETKRR
jgi:hypothetical protein